MVHGQLSINCSICPCQVTSSRSHKCRWSMVDGPWSRVHGRWSMVDGPWLMVHGRWSERSLAVAVTIVDGPWSRVHGWWSMVNNQVPFVATSSRSHEVPWSMVNGPWSMSILSPLATIVSDICRVISQWANRAYSSNCPLAVESLKMPPPGSVKLSSCWE